MLEDLLAPASVAADGLPDVMPKVNKNWCVFYIVKSLCVLHKQNVSSVVGNVLDETIDDEDFDYDYFGNSFKLLNNTAVVDEVAGKFGVPEEERAQQAIEDVVMEWKL